MIRATSRSIGLATFYAPETIAESVKEILKKGGGLGHIVNLGHGILPMVPIENARAFIEAAKARIKEVA